MQLLVPVPKRSAFYSTDQKVENEENLDAHIPDYKNTHTYAAGSWPDKCTTYLLFMGSSLLPKDSCGPETADKHTKPCFFIWARRWLQMPRDMELNHKHTIIWCDHLSCANTWLRHLCSSGLPADGNCHFVGMRALGDHVWEKRQANGNLWLESYDLYMYMSIKGLVFCAFFMNNGAIP